jgi:hypothetical protein
MSARAASTLARERAHQEASQALPALERQGMPKARPSTALALVACDSQPASPSSTANGEETLSAATRGRAGTSMVVYGTSQRLYYDTFVARDPLPMEGRFQQLSNGQTEFGSGDPGYLGGRWWEDSMGTTYRTRRIITSCARCFLPAVNQRERLTVARSCKMARKTLRAIGIERRPAP